MLQVKWKICLRGEISSVWLLPIRALSPLSTNLPSCSSKHNSCSRIKVVYDFQHRSVSASASKAPRSTRIVLICRLINNSPVHSFLVRAWLFWPAFSPALWRSYSEEPGQTKCGSMGRHCVWSRARDSGFGQIKCKSRAKSYKTEATVSIMLSLPVSQSTCI